MRALTMSLGVLLLPVAACNDGGGGDGEAPARAGVEHYVTAAGVVDEVRAAVPLDEYRASDGSTWLELRRGRDRTFVPRGERGPDLGGYHFGRGDVARPSAPTDVAIELTGLAPWTAGDSLQIVTPNAGLALTGIEDGLRASPPDGAQAVRGDQLAWQGARAPLVDAGRGDATWVLQLESAPLGAGTSYRAVTRAGLARDFTVRDRDGGTLTATLAELTPRTLGLRWQGRAFAALAAEAGPYARPAPAPAIAIRALPSVLAQHGAYAGTLYTGLPSLVELGPVSGSADLEDVIGYGDPFAAGAWTEIATLVYPMPVYVPTPDGVASTTAMMVSATAIASDRELVELAPSVTPVRDARLDGQPLAANVVGASASPTIAWQAPARGAVTGYRVTISAVVGAPTGVTVTRLATFHTAATAVAIPATVLADARSYLVTITAIAAPGLDVTGKPLVGALPYASADYVSALVTR